MRMVASAVLAALVSLILFYAMHSMIAGNERPLERPVMAGLRFVQVDEVNLTTVVAPGKRQVPLAPDFRAQVPPLPRLSFDPAIQPALPPPVADTPNLPLVKPGGKPYLGTYVKPSKAKTSISPPAKVPDKTAISAQGASPTKSVTNIPSARSTYKPAEPVAHTSTDQAVHQAPSISRDSGAASGVQAASGSAGPVTAGTKMGSEGISAVHDGSTGRDDLGAEEEVVAIYKTIPAYPRKAARSGEEGWVKIEFTITAHGGVADPKVVASKPRRIFDRAALKAIKNWRFKPKKIDGKAVSRRAVQVIEFRLATG